MLEEQKLFRHGKDGRDGRDGHDGHDGIDGQRGPIGKDGKSGRDGEKGLDGVHGRDGINGKDGRDGIDGKDGKDGARGPIGFAKDGAKGDRGPKGDKGDTGPIPDHKWEGTALKFEKPDGDWGQLVDLKGDKGPPGRQGNSGGGGFAAVGTGGTGGTVPSGTGYVHVTSGSQDAAAVTPTTLTADLNVVVGDSGSGGTKGLVPAPAAGDAASGKFLKADGTFQIPAGSGAGTVTNTGGNLTSNAVVLGAGTVDAKVVAGIITDGTSKVTLGVAGASVGSVDFKNATSGTVTLAPVTGALGTVTLSLPAATGTIARTADITGTNSGTNTGDQTITLTGDVTGSGTGSFAATIAANAVSNAKAAQMAANTFKANNTGSTANAADITVAQAKTLLAIAASDVSGLATVATSGSAADLSTGTLPAGRMPALTGDVTTSAGAVATTIANNAVTNTKAAQMAAHTFKGNATGSTANASDLSATTLTSELNAMVGDSGSGGTKGLVPAPASGDAAAGKFLKADGTFAVPSGTGSGTVTNTGGNLTSNAIVLGAGTVDTKVAAGIITDGTSKFTLGVAGASVGSVDFKNATSGTVTLAPVAGALGTVTLSLPAATGTIARTADITGTNSGTNTGDQTITLTGDVTGSGTGSFAATIGANKVTLAQMATVATATMLGRTTAGTGNVEALTVLPAALHPALTGDITNSAGSLATTLATVNSNVGSFVHANITVNAKGLITAASSGPNTFTLEVLIGDGTNVITTGLKTTAVVVAPRAGTITGWTILSCDAASPTSGSIVFDIWKDTYANYPPTIGDTITASAKPTVTTATKATSTTLTSWTTSIAAGDVLFVNVDSVTSFKSVKLILSYTA